MAGEVSVLGWALLLVLIATALIGLGRRARARSGLPAGDIVYSDSGWGQVRRPLISRRHRLSGKPDYLVRAGRAYIPVEVKSSPAPPHGPYPAHVFQLAAYCLLVHENYGRRPKHGLIKYDDDTFEVDYTSDLEVQVVALLAEMRADLRARDVARSHQSVARCRGCGFRPECNQSLV